ncbi:MAG: ATP-binding cassette domain-containing protein [Chloracidobacterium sp.]|nr:ATP-binding cassette domain-containing protein [Chloracidobacterium sp.]
MNTGDSPAIEFRNVSISFDDLQALKNIRFTLPRGETLCVTGDSGSGKSVLLRLALGLLRPDEGQILINGRETTSMEEDDLMALRREVMGMVFQENSFFSGLTVYENTAYRLDDRNWPADEIERAVVEVLTFVGLQDDQEKQAEDLSGGMKRRLELARALIGWPSIMLYDEPTAGLDPINARHVLDLIIRARDLHHTSSILVTKSLHEIPYLARHQARDSAQEGPVVEVADHVPGVQVCLLEKGGIAFFGRPQEFAQSSLPAVQHMLHPMTGAARDKFDVDDPWRQNQKTRRLPI